MRLRCLATVVVACASLAIAQTTVQEASSPLALPDLAPQPHAHGSCDVRTGPDFDRFRISLEGLNESVPLVVFLGDGHETMNAIGELPAGTSVRTLLRTTQEGGALPYAADTVRALGERRIEVRDGEQHLVLRGSVPVLPPETDGGGGVTEPPPADAPVVTRSTMHRTDEAGDRQVRGTLVATRRADGSALRLEIGRFAAETHYLVYVWTDRDLVLWDEVRTNREGAAALTGDTAEGPGLPLHAESVVELAGTRVEVRDAAGHLLLYGEVPAAQSARDTEPVHADAVHTDAETGADVHVVVDVRPERGHEQLRIVVRDIPRDGAPAKSRRRFVDVRLADAEGAMQHVTDVRVRRGRARLRYDSRRGDELPLGAESVRDLSGRAFEVRLGGARVASGTLPQL